MYDQSAKLMTPHPTLVPSDAFSITAHQSIFTKVKQLNALLNQRMEQIRRVLHVLERMLIARDFADSIREVPLVEALYLILAEETADLWAITSQRSLKAELTISKAFAELLRQYPDTNLDFLILPREGRRLENILPRNGVMVWRREGKRAP